MAKDIVKRFRLGSSEAAMLKEQAEKAGMNESQYVRFLITQKPNDYPGIQKSLKGLVNEINRIGVNINEIVYNNNSMLYRQTDKDRLMAYMRRLNKTLEEAVVRLGYH
ncbi:MAG: MobC family plasmid mobilization relaxosome protein [Lachnospiraceae bacterium]